jgi:GntR family transcriptional regulator
MFVKTGARDVLLKGERQKFLSEQWPRIHATIERLGLTPDELLSAAPTRPSTNNEEEKS